MSKWIEIEVNNVDIIKYFKQVYDEFEWFVYGSKTTLNIYKHTKTWMKRVLEILIEQKIPFVFIPCNYERYCVDITYNESYKSFDYKTYVNLKNLIGSQIEIKVTSQGNITHYWDKPFEFRKEELVNIAKLHILAAKPKQKFYNLVEMEKWEDNNPFKFDPWNSDIHEELEVYSFVDSYTLRLNDKHPDYFKAKGILEEIERVDFDIDKTLKIFNQLDTIDPQNKRTMCFLIEVLSYKINDAEQIFEHDIRKKLKKLIKKINQYKSTSRPSNVLKIVSNVREIIMQPDYERFFNGMTYKHSNSETYCIYKNFVKYALDYFKDSKLINEEIYNREIKLINPPKQKAITCPVFVDKNEPCNTELKSATNFILSKPSIFTNWYVNNYSIDNWRFIINQEQDSDLIELKNSLQELGYENINYTIVEKFVTRKYAKQVIVLKADDNQAFVALNNLCEDGYHELLASFEYEDKYRLVDYTFSTEFYSQHNVVDLLDDNDIVNLGFVFNLQDIDDKYEILKIVDKAMAIKFIKYPNPDIEKSNIA